MNRINEIVAYFFKHDFSKKMVKRVHYRLVEEEKEEKEVEQAMENIWNTMNIPAMNDEELNKALLYQKNCTFSKQKKVIRMKWMQIAALWFIPIVLAATSFYMFHKTNSIKQDIAHISFIEKHVPEGVTEVVTLPDGSVVTLNSGTSLIYPTKFLKEKREVFLSGEGYFCVTSNKKSPFYVNTTPIKVKVLGTKFNVSVYPDDVKAVTTLEKGSVGVFIQGKEEKGDGCVLLPNEQLIYNKKTGEMEKRSVEPHDYSSWKEGELSFREVTLSEIIPVLERHYKVFIYAKEKKLHNDTITVSFNKNESLENVLKLIQQVVPGMQFQLKGENVYIATSELKTNE